MSGRAPFRIAILMLTILLLECETYANNCDFFQLLPRSAVEAPPKPHIVPRPVKPYQPSQPIPEPEPKLPPRRAPHPAPDRKITPTEDPKDILPRELYEHDKTLEKFWKNLSPSTQAELENSTKLEFEELKKRYQDSFLGGKKATDHEILFHSARKVIELQEKIAQLEAKHKTQIEAVVQKMTRDFYGPAVADKIKMELSQQLPSRPEQMLPEKHFKIEQSADDRAKAAKTQAQKESDINITDYVFRRELYNAVSQAHGWNGMKNFAYYYAEELKGISPQLPELYQDLHTVYRLTNYLIVEHGLSHGEDLRHIDRDQISHGREIVNVEFETLKDPETEEQMLTLKKVSAVAVGKNGWALAHEATKAGFEVATALEASQRAPLTKEERLYLETRTNSNLSEIRQGIFGMTMNKKLSTFVRLAAKKWLGRDLSNQEFYQLYERVFSWMSDAQLRDLFAKSFENPTDKLLERTAAQLREMGVFSKDALEH